MIKNIIYFKVAGVSFRNEDGSSRQDIISKLHDDDVLHFVPYVYEDEPAYHIVTESGKCIGNVPKDYIQDVTDAINDPDNDYMLAVSDISARDEDGVPLEGYNQGVTVALYIHDDARHPKSDPLPVASAAPAPAKKKRGGTLLIVFGVSFGLGFFVAFNPVCAVLAGVCLYFGIRKRKAG